ncbi:MAG TPA: hypothetical protein PK293_06385 [Spirochaetota bacterium]|nr:hypothetical protein [Spirochaetota bacterium]HPR36762.1 hypothetical protein [Spirochaetota bacterium]
MKDIDKTKSNIKLHEIDEKQRKELFQKFSDAGGKVLSERDVRRGLVIDREKQKKHQQRLDEHYKSMKTTVTKPAYSKKPLPAGIKNRPLSEDTPWNKFRIRMRLRFMRVTGFNTLFLHEKYLDSFTSIYKTSLMEIQMAYLALFKRDPNLGGRIIVRLDKVSPLYYAVLERAGEIYEPMIIDQITEKYLAFPSVPQPITDLKEQFIDLFRPLYILKPYENTLMNAFEKSITLYSDMADSKNAKSIKKKDIRNALFIIFDKLYPRLHALFCQYYGILFDESDSRIEDILSIAPAERPEGRRRGTRQASAFSTESYSEQETEISDTEEDKTDVQEEDVTVKEGLKLMYGLDFNTLKKIYDKKNRFDQIYDNDKTFLAYLLFLEFENEYSVILTTNQIKFNIDFSSSTKVDYRETMQELFNRMRKCHEAFFSYYDSYGSYCKIRNAKPISNEQYITYTKRLDEVTKRKNDIGTQCRYIIRVFMDNVAHVLTELVDDMNSRQFYINNPQDILELFYQIEGEKKLKDKKIYDSIQIAQRFAAAMAHRLSPGGDLTGTTEFSEDSSMVTDELSDEQGTSKRDSILDELDDII